MRWFILGLIGGGLVSGLASVYYQLLGSPGGNDEAMTYKLLMWMLWIIALIILVMRVV